MSSINFEKVLNDFLSKGIMTQNKFSTLILGVVIGK